MLIIHTPDRRNSSTKGSEGNKAGYGVSGARTVYEGLKDRVKIKGENIGVVFCILDFRREGKERGYTLVVSRDCPQLNSAFIKAHKFSIGFKSGEYGGQLITQIFISSRIS